MNNINKLVALEHEAAEFGFAWENPHQIMEQIQSECSEIKAHFDKIEEKKHLQEEIGDLLHAVYSLCVFCQFDPQTTLEMSIVKFERRFNMVKQLAKNKGLFNLKNHSFDELMQLWNQAKQLTDTGK